MTKAVWTTKNPDDAVSSVEIPLDNFTGVKLKKAYNNLEKVTETGIYFHSADLTFDLIHVSMSHLGEVKSRSVVTKIPEAMAFEDAKKMYPAALKQLEAFERRVSAKNNNSERTVGL